MTSMQGLPMVLGSKFVRTFLGVLAVIVLGWAGYASRSTASAGAAQAGPASAQAPVPVEESLSAAYSSWISTTHERVMKDGQAAVKPDQF